MTKEAKKMIVGEREAYENLIMQITQYRQHTYNIAFW